MRDGRGGATPGGGKQGGPKGGAQKRGAPKRGAPKGDIQKHGAPKGGIRKRVAPRDDGSRYGGPERGGRKPSGAKTERTDRRPRPDPAEGTARTGRWREDSGRSGPEYAAGKPPASRGAHNRDRDRAAGPVRGKPGGRAVGTRGRSPKPGGRAASSSRERGPERGSEKVREQGPGWGRERGPERGRGRSAGPARPSSAPAEEGASERIQKRLAAAGIGSRRTVDQWVAEGRVRVNGRVAAAGTRIRSGDRVRIDGRRVFVPSAADTCRLLLYHKPPGEVTTRRDPEGRRTVFESLPRLRSERWVAVGRLDINTSGLILFATLGELAHRLMHPRYRMEREYAVRVLGRVDAEMIRNLRRGVTLDDGSARFLHIEEEGGEGANRWFRVVLEEGRNREVHRLWESQGVRVSRLIRVRFGPVRLPSRLPAGAFMDVSDRERAALFETVELEDPGPPAAVRRRAPPRAR